MCFFHRPGTFLLRESPAKHDLLHLHYLPAQASTAGALSSPSHDPSASSLPPLKLRSVQIHRTQAGKYKLAGDTTSPASSTFDSVNELVRVLRDPGQKHRCSLSGGPLKDCLHPSEYDKAPTLLICRSIKKLRAGEGLKDHVFNLH